MKKIKNYLETEKKQLQLLTFLLPYLVFFAGECASPEPTKYTITFNSDNGTAVSTITVTSGNKATKPTNPSKTGYTFVDWYKEATLTNVFDFNTAITANITLYAKWTAVSYKVTLDANKGTPGTTTTITVEQGKTVPTSTTGLPTFTGHTLVGWNTKADGTGTGFVFGDTPVFADITLYAKWTINVYIVTLDANGGTPGTTTIIKVEHGKTVPTSTSTTALPTFTGHNFLGWKTKADDTGTGFVFGDTPVFADITLYAQWSNISYTVTLDPNGGTAGSTTKVSVYHGQTVPSSISINNLPTRMNYQLLGWNTSADGKGSEFVFGTTVVTTDITIYAKWTINVYTVTLDANGGTPGTTTIIEVEHGKTVPTSTTGLPTFTGYNFEGWNTNANGRGSAFLFGTTVVTTDITIYAKWTEIKVNSLTFDKKDYTMCFNRNSELRLIVSPSNALNKNIGYTVTGDMNSSGTNNIISVTYTNGVFTITPKGGDARGVTTLTVTSKDGSNISATINITVGDYFFIPDEAFRAVAKRYSVLPNPIFVETIDGVDALNTQKAAAYSGNLNFQDKGVTDVTGIEYFTGITHLNIGINKITSLDLSKSKELEVVGCEENPSLKTLNVKGLSKLTTLIANNSILESVDISGCKSLEKLHLHKNKLVSLNLVDNVELTELLCDNNNLASLDVAINTKLVTLSCSINPFTKNLILTSNTALEHLDCNALNLTELNLTRCTKLKTLFVNLNRLTTLDVTENVQLTTLECRSNLLKSLDLSKNSLLTKLICIDNELTTLDLRGMRSINDKNNDAKFNFLIVTLLDGTNLAPGNDITAVKIHYSLLGGGTPTQGVPLLTLGTAYTELNRVKNKGTNNGTNVQFDVYDYSVSNGYTSYICDYDLSTGLQVASSPRSCR